MVEIDIEDDDLDEMMMAAPSPREAKKMDHELMHKVASHPLRRKIVKSIGVFGKTKEDILDEVGIDGASFKYQIEVLLSANFLKIEDDQYRLTDKGLDMLANIN